jgi:hypothetical protein
MNRKISLAVGTAAAVAFTGMAHASDLLTINQTDQYVDPSVAGSFIPYFVQPGGDCNAPVGGTSTVGCPDHGAALVGQAAGIEPENYFSGGDAVPAFSHTPADSWALVGPTGDNPFMSGIFRSDGTSYFTGLNYACDTPGDAIATNCNGMGAAPDGAGFGEAATTQSEWIDQTLVGYVESLANLDGNDANGGEGDITLAQNLRVQFNMTGTSLDPGVVGSDIDQRLEQMVELDGATGFNDTFGGLNASRQTFQQAFGTGGASSGNPTASGGGGHFMLGQLVAQDIEGFLFSCMSCDTSANGGDHTVTPNYLEVRYNPYAAGWDVVPTVIHGGQP